MSNFELQFVDWVRGNAPRCPSIEVGIGDDMGLLAGTGDRLLVSADILLEGVHFDSSVQSLRQIGRKAIACGLSDCAAMAVRPLAAVISVAFPTTWDLTEAQNLFNGAFEIAREYELGVLGGDTARWKSELVIDVAVMAMPFSGIPVVTRSNARVGDRLFVTGFLGGSIVAKHLSFTPHVARAYQLAKSLGSALHAMMDITDGLSLDCWRMSRASSVGAILDERKIEAVASDDARRLAGMDGRSVLEHVLSDGEDFELLVAINPSATQTSGVKLFEVGEIVSNGFKLRKRDGTLVDLIPTGFVH